MSAFAPPAGLMFHARPPATKITRDRPYGVFVDDAFDRGKHGVRYRRLLRWSYRAFRDQHHSSPFSARAQIANMIIQLDWIAEEIAAPIPPVGARHAEGDQTATSAPSATSLTNGDPT